MRDKATKTISIYVCIHVCIYVYLLCELLEKVKQLQCLEIKQKQKTKKK